MIRVAVIRWGDGARSDQIADGARYFFADAFHFLESLNSGVPKAGFSESTAIRQSESNLRFPAE